MRRGWSSVLVLGVAGVFGCSSDAPAEVVDTLSADAADAADGADPADAADAADATEGTDITEESDVTEDTATADGSDGTDASTGVDSTDSSDGNTDACPIDASDCVEFPVDCNPLLAGGDCMLPYPSDAFLADDATTPSGHRVAIPDKALPTHFDGSPLDISRHYPSDGWSVAPTILTLFQPSVHEKHQVLYGTDLMASVADDSETLIVDAETGDRILHIAELDPRAELDKDRLFSLRPQARLKNGHRYIVAIRGLTRKTGEPVDPPPVFRLLLNNPDMGPPSHFAPLLAHYNSEIFPVLEKYGIARDTLQLAWDFTTRSGDDAMADMLAIRSAVLAAIDTTPPAVTITEVKPDPNDQTGREIHGTLAVPRYIDQDAAGAHISRGPDGKPKQNGMATVPFVAVVPKSVLDGTFPGPVRALQFGHGFFGDLSEVTGSFVRTFAQDHGFIVFAVEWWGMDETDRVVVAETLFKDPENTLLFIDRLHQGMANQLALTVAIKTTMPAVPELNVGEALLYDPSHVFYYGISQGHILGGTLLALSPDLDRGVLGVGGAAFSHMMMRSTNFGEFLLLMQKHAFLPIEQGKVVAMTQQAFDRFDPITYAPHVLVAPLPGRTVPMRVLMQAGLGDPQVPNFTSRLHARALGLTQLEPLVESAPQLPHAAGPLESGYVEFDFGIASPRPGDIGVPPEVEDDPVHEGVRRGVNGQKQVDAFLKPDGQVTATCDGPCDPE